jgi:hypothetical protein
MVRETRTHKMYTQIAVGKSAQLSYVFTMIKEITKRVGPDMRVNGEIMRSHISIACT